MLIINRLAIKSNAKLIIADTKPSPIMVGLVYIGLDLLLTFLQNQLLGYGTVVTEIMEQYNRGNLDYVPQIPEITLPAWLLVLAINLMSVMLSAGFTIYSYRVCTKQKADVKTLFDGFNIFFKIIWLEIVISFFVFLWSLLFIIPGIVASYRYRQALYILIDDPSLGALDCIRMSKKMMRHHKTELFAMDLSFLGWAFLTSLFFPAGIWYYPYSSICYASYYLALKQIPDVLNGRMEP